VFIIAIYVIAGKLRQVCKRHEIQGILLLGSGLLI
jgi:hypothetical protein